MNKIDVKVTPVFNGQELKIFETKCGRYSFFNFYYDPDTECWCFFPTPGSQNRTIFEDKDDYFYAAFYQEETRATPIDV